MKLSQLILEQKESILEEFEEFARTHTSPGASMDVAALRDHAAGILEALARDLEETRSEAEQERESKGDAPRPEHAKATAAHLHGTDRASSGFSLVEAIAEYRSLRASVLRHWIAAELDPPQAKIQDVIRFNEVLDKAIAESVDEYSKAVAGYRDMFLAVLGHDLRSPLQAIMNASTVLSDFAELSDRDERLAHTIQRSGERMLDLIADMLDFTRAQLGEGIPLRPQPADLAEVVAEAVGEARATHPNSEFRLSVEGELTGEWDVRRVRQAISNLLDNAAQHGAPESPITITVTDANAGDDLIVSVHNLGAAIPPGEQEQVFDPFRRGSSDQKDDSRGSVGLGLFIARQVAEAHGGGLGVKSERGKGTTFRMRLSQAPSQARAFL